MTASKTRTATAWTGHARPRASRGLRATIWLALAVVLGGAAVGAQSSIARQTERNSARLEHYLERTSHSASATVVAPDTSAQSPQATRAGQPGDAERRTIGTMGQVAGGAALGPRAETAYTAAFVLNQQDACAACASRVAYYESDPLKAAPAWRWPSLPFPVQLKWSRVVQSILNAIAAFLFGISRIIWSFTLLVLRFSMTDLLSRGLGPIDRGFVAVSRNPLLISLIGLGWFVSLWRIGKLALKGNASGVLRTAVIFLIPIAFLVYMKEQAPKTLAESGNGHSIVTGSPSWFAHTGVSNINKLGAVAMEPINFIGTRTEAGSTGTKNQPGCTGYVQVLSSMSKHTPTRNGTGNTAITSTLSSLWEASQLSVWNIAVFGLNGKTGEKVYCHVLDANNRVPVWEQQYIQAAAYPQLGTASDARNTAGGSGYKYAALAILDDGAGKLHVASWMACYWEGEWKVDPRWASVGKDGGLGEQTQDDQNYCQRWYEGLTKEMSSVAPNPDQLAEGAQALADEIIAAGCTEDGRNNALTCADAKDDAAAVIAGGAWGDRDDQTEYLDYDELKHLKDGTVYNMTHENDVDSNYANSAFDAFLGVSAGTRLGLGFLAVISAGFYAFAMVGLGLGCLMAQFALILLFAFLPVTLVLLALQSRGGSKLLRMTISMMATKLVFGILICVLVGVIYLGTALVDIASVGSGGFGVAQAGFGEAMLAGVMPLASLWLVRRLASAMGMGNITSLKGGLGFTTAAAMRATGAGSLADLSAGKTGDSTMMGRMRSKAKDATKRGALLTGKSVIPEPIRNWRQKRELGRLAKVSEHLQDKSDKLGADYAKETVNQERRAKVLDKIDKALANPNLNDERRARLEQRRDDLDELQATGKKNLAAWSRKKDGYDQSIKMAQRRQGNLEGEIIRSDLLAKQVQGYVKVGAAVAGGVLAGGGLGFLAAAAAPGLIGASGAFSFAATAPALISGGAAAGAAMVPVGKRHFKQKSLEAAAQEEAEVLNKAEASRLRTQGREAAAAIHTTTVSGREASQQTLDAKRAIRLGSVGAPNKAEAVAAIAMGQAVELAGVMGGRGLDGGWMSATEAQGLASGCSYQWGKESGVSISADQIMVSDHGAVVLNPLKFTQDQIAAMDVPFLEKHPELFALSHPGLRQALGNQPSDRSAANELVANLCASGYYSVVAGPKEGEQQVAAVSVLAANGISNDAAGRARLEAIARGQAPPPAMTLSFDPAQLGAGMRSAALSGDYMTELAVHEAKVQEVQNVRTGVGALSVHIEGVTAADGDLSRVRESGARAAQAASLCGSSDPQIAAAAAAAVGEIVQQAKADAMAAISQISAANSQQFGYGTYCVGVQYVNDPVMQAQAGRVVEVEAQAVQDQLDQLQAEIANIRPMNVGGPEFEQKIASLERIAASVKFHTDTVAANMDSLIATASPEQATYEGKRLIVTSRPTAPVANMTTTSRLQTFASP